MTNLCYSNQCSLFCILFLLTTITSPALAQLSEGFYATTCPSVFDTVRTATRAAVDAEARMGASLIRLFFHDCFVNGCDAGLLLDETTPGSSEKTQIQNANSVRGFEVIDDIKTQVDAACGAVVVSCADILAIAARDSVVQLGGPNYVIPVGRRDGLAASPGQTGDLPGFNEDLGALIDKFSAKSFTAQEMVALSGAHTVGQAQCFTFRARIYDPNANIDPAYATSLQANCPNTTGTGDSNLAPLDSVSPNGFGNEYFTEVINRRGLLASDQVLFNNGSTDAFVTTYSNNPTTFSTDFGNAMVKMGSLSILTGNQGEIRSNCRVIN